MNIKTFKKIFFLLIHFQSQQEWNLVFIIAAMTYMIGCVIYWFLASGELQTWAKAKEGETQVKNENPEKIKAENETRI